MIRLAIVIPVLDNLQGMEETLVSVLENRPSGCQIVVVLNRPYDDPYDLKDEVFFVEVPRAAKVSTALNAALATSRATVLHVLACGVEVAPGWVEDVLPLFADSRLAAVAPLLLHKGRPPRVLAAGLQYSSGGIIRRLGEGKSAADQLPAARDFCGPDLVAAFYRRSAIEVVGGFDGKLDGPAAAVDLALRLRQAGLQSTLSTSCQVYADPRRLPRQSALRRGRTAEYLFWRWASSRGRSHAALRHAGLLASQCLQAPLRPGKIVELAGRLLGGVQFAVAGRRPASAAVPPQPVRSALAGPHFAASGEERPIPATIPGQHLGT